MARSAVLKPLVAFSVMAHARDASLLYAFAVPLCCGNVEANAAIIEVDARNLDLIRYEPIMRSQ